MDYCFNNNNLNENNNQVFLSRLAQKLVFHAKKDFNKLIRDVYVNEIGRSMGSDDSLFADREEAGGPPRKKQKISTIADDGDDADMFSISGPIQIISKIYSLLVTYGNDENGKYKTAVTKIAKWWKKRKCYLPTANGIEEDLEEKHHHNHENNKWVKCLGKPIKCPITLDTICSNDVVVLISPEGRVVAYTCSVLIQFLKSSKDFRCPLLRFNFNRIQVKSIVKQADKLGIHSAGLLNLFDTKDNEITAMAERDSVVTGLERTCAEVFDVAVLLSENEELGPFDILNILENEILPEWRTHVRALATLSLETCRVSLSVEKERLQELNDTIPDPNGVLTYLITQIEEEQESLREFESTRHQLNFVDRIFDHLMSRLDPPSMTRRQRTPSPTQMHPSSSSSSLLSPLASPPPPPPPPPLPPPIIFTTSSSTPSAASMLANRYSNDDAGVYSPSSYRRRRVESNQVRQPSYPPLPPPAFATEFPIPSSPVSPPPPPPPPPLPPPSLLLNPVRHLDIDYASRQNRTANRNLSSQQRFFPLIPPLNGRGVE